MLHSEPAIHLWALRSEARLRIALRIAHALPSPRQASVSPAYALQLGQQGHLTTSKCLESRVIHFNANCDSELKSDTIAFLGLISISYLRLSIGNWLVATHRERTRTIRHSALARSAWGAPAAVLTRAVQGLVVAGVTGSGASV